MYDPEFDFPPQEEVSKSLMVATLPRSGSTYFCIRLWQTGVLGAPMEYPNFGTMKTLFSRLQSKDWVDYWRKVKRLRTSPNGVFGYKMFISNMMEIGREHSSLLKEFAPDYVVYLTRKNVVDQALSYHRAIKTRAWFGGVQEQVSPAYNKEEIIDAVKQVKRQHVFWENIFSVTEANVYRTTYEDFLEQPEVIIEDIVNMIGVEQDKASRLDIPMIGIQRDEVTDDWRQRFLDEVDVDSIKVKQVSISPCHEPIPWQR